MKFISKSVEQTIEIGKNFAGTLVGGDVILVDGDLGAGKTHFAKGVATGLGVTDTVTSRLLLCTTFIKGKNSRSITLIFIA